MKSSETELSYDLTYKDVVDFLKIIDDSTCKELHLELGDLKLDIIKGPQGNPAPAVKEIQAGVGPHIPTPQPEAKSEDAAVTMISEKTGDKPATRDISGTPIYSPLSGTFYRTPSPGEKPFVEVGRKVKAGDQLAIVEVMKLMNSIKAPRNGTIREILAENETNVEMGQVLMTMDPPSAKGKAKVSTKKKK